MMVVEGLKYSNDHEWVRLEGGRAYIGITDFAQSSMGDIVFVELPAVGADIPSGGTLGVVESFKSTSDVLSPVAGKVAEVNEALSASPELINTAPYENWIAVLEVADAGLDGLMDSAEYEKYCKTLE